MNLLPKSKYNTLAENIKFHIINLVTINAIYLLGGGQLSPNHYASNINTLQIESTNELTYHTL